MDYMKNNGFRLYRGDQPSAQTSIATASFDGGNWNDKKPIRISFDRDMGKSSFIKLPSRLHCSHRAWEVDGIELSVDASREGGKWSRSNRQISTSAGPLATFQGTFWHTGEEYGTISLKTDMDQAMLDLVVLGFLSDAEKAYQVNTFIIAVT
jgi:hypothetical protein